MLIIAIKGTNIESALKDYKRKVQKIKQIEHLRARQKYEKPSVKKRVMIEDAKLKNKKNL